jgi:hypothetical protein
MASDLGVGDSELAFVDVAPADADTQAVLTVNPPPTAGSSYTLTASGGDLQPIDGSDDLQQRWTTDDPVTYTAPGRWVLHWDVAGTGEAQEDYEVYVVASPVAGGPAWTPGRSRVANYVPRRTLQRSLSSSASSQDAYEMTFGQDTIPNGVQTDRLIADGVAWVSARVVQLATSMYDAASVCAAIYAAAMIERSWPDDDQALQRANDLERRLDVLLKDLVAANDLANGSDYGLDVAPAWSFPPADCRWDSARYW